MRLFTTKRSRSCSAPAPGALCLEILEDRTLLSAAPLSWQFQRSEGLLSLVSGATDPVVSASLSPSGFVQLNVGGKLHSSDPHSASYDSALAGATGQSLQAIQLNGNAGLDHLVLGNLSLASGLTVQCDGLVDIHGQVSAGGPIQLSGQAVLVSGQVRADGASGGSIVVTAGSVLQSGLLEADGSQGSGGFVHIDFTNRYLATQSALTSASSTGTGAGGVVVVDGQGGSSLFSSGQYRASAVHGQQGGQIDLFAQQVQLVGANINASGWSGGGWVRVGGDSPSDLAVRGGSDTGVTFADTTKVDATTSLTVNALGAGNGGHVVVWSQTSTTFDGTLCAQGAGPVGQGGMLEVSSAGLLTYGGHASATASAGRQGQLLLDPANLDISNGAGLPQFNLLNPAPGPNDTFGASMVTLSNGNVVVTDPSSGLAGPANSGAVYLFDGQTGALLATLLGSTKNDGVGSGGVTALSNGNYVVSSPSWQSGGAAVGAATWASGSGSGVTAVSAANSLVGSTSGDEVSIGDQLAGSTGIEALSNGNYVVISPFWQSAGAMVGAVTWGNGTVGTNGAVSTSNSLVGSTAGDQVGSQGVTTLNNGNYVVSSPSWQIGGVQVGAATWGNGVGGTVGPVSSANSLVGEPNQGSIAIGGVTALSTGNYVVVSPGWQDADGNAVGAVTWGNGGSGTVGEVTPGNSLIGASNFDLVGQDGVTALTNGDYVVSSSYWKDAHGAVGAVTWAASDGSTVGVVSAGNSLIGSTAGDHVGSGGVTALTNGNYVVSSPKWQDDGADVGAVTWGKGDGGTVGTVTTSNSLVGSTTGDKVGFGNGNPGSGVTALSNGNYVVSSPFWQHGGADVGAVTWSNGSTGKTLDDANTIDAANSLIGSTDSDQVGSGGVTVLTNGNYVVSSPSWQNSLGAVTWSAGDGGTVGAVTASNSLVGSTAVPSGDHVGSGGVIALSNGNYIVSSPDWQNGGSQVGAATWGNGSTGQTLDSANTIDAANSFIGAGDGAVLQQVVGFSGGSSFLASFSGNGGTVLEVQLAASAETYATASTQTVSLTPSFLTATLDTGTAVVLQASNDITVSSAIVVDNPNGNGGNLTLQAGGNINLNANITTDNGNLTLVANDTGADGVVDAQREPGRVFITVGLGTMINAGTGTVTISLDNGAGNTNTASGSIILEAISAATVSITNSGPSAGSDVVLGEPITATIGLSITAAGSVTLGSSPVTLTAPTTTITGNLALGAQTLTVDGALNLTSSDVFTEQLQSTGQAAPLTVSGAVNLGNASLSVLLPPSPYTPVYGDFFTILQYGSIIGSFSQGGVVQAGSNNLAIGYAATGNSVALTVVPLNAPFDSARLLPDPSLPGKQALFIQGGNGNDVITVAPGKVAHSFVVTIDASPAQTITGVTGSIVVYGLVGNDQITLNSKITAPAFLSGGAGNDTLTGGSGVNTLVESGPVDFVLVGGTSKVNGSLTKGTMGTDTLVRNHIQQAQLTITGSVGHTIDATGFTGNATLMGGAGNDILKAGTGNTVLVGGGGNDQLFGSALPHAGRALLIGGAGSDTLVGGSNSDLLIAGSTDFDTNLVALNAIMAEWTSTSSYATRIKYLMGTLTRGKNGSMLLTASTVHDDGGKDVLTGGGGQDWFWANLSEDTITDLVTTGRLAETVTPL